MDVDPRCGSLPIQHHVVYRALDRDDVVLYVGVTNSLFARMAQHRRSSPWWTSAVRIDWTIYDNRVEAETAERTAIHLHSPHWNIVDHPRGLLDPIERDRLADLAEATRASIAGRDEAIREAVAAGISLRRVGKAAGLSHQAINNICKR